MSAQEEITALFMRRENIKLELLEKQALQSSRHHRFIAYGESSPLEERLELEAEIAALEADKQSIKLRLLQLKEVAKQEVENNFQTILWRMLSVHGLESIAEEARKEAREIVKQGDLGPAYKLKA